MYKIVTHVKLDSLTNQITYNRLLRSTRKILNLTVFKFNDSITRFDLQTKLKQLYMNSLSSRAITNYQITIKDFDPQRPHYIELDIIISMPNMIEHVFVNINNVNE